MRQSYLVFRLFCVMIAGLLVSPLHAQEALSPGLGPTHALAMHGSPKHGPDFSHFDYANPNAPKGGKLVLGDVATFDSLNPYLALGGPCGTWPFRAGSSTPS